jgi:lipoate-protein ligase A
LWRLIPFQVNSAALNMAIDESISEGIAQGSSPPTIRFYGWSPSAVTIGCFQSMDREVDTARCQELGVHFVRRRTGGGAVYHDERGEITYSIIAPEDWMGEDILFSYREICGKIVEALDRLGIPSEFQPINDILVHGKKISGSAQTRRNGVFLQHGTLLYRIDPSTMFSVLRVSPEKNADKALDKVEERVTSVSSHRSISRDRVLEEMRRLSGKNFDPEVIDAFFDSLDTLKAIAKRYPDVNGE